MDGASHFFQSFLIHDCYRCTIWAEVFGNGHTTLSTPVLVRSLKLSNVGLG